MERDFEDLKKPRSFHKDTRRPIWKGPVPDRYYYIVRNKGSKKYPGALVVPFSDVKKFESHIRQICTCQGGLISLIESDVPLPIKKTEKVKQTLGKMLSHSKIARVKEKLFLSHERRGEDEIMGEIVLLDIPGEPFKDNEVFI